MDIIGIRKLCCIYQIVKEVDLFQLKRSYNPFKSLLYFRCVIMARALHGVGNPWGPVFPMGNGWKWVNFQGNLWGGAVTGGKQGPHNISQFLRL